MPLSHCVVIRIAPGVAASGVACAVASGVAASGAFLFAMMALASSKAFFCASRASLVFSAIALPAATRFGFFVFVVCDVTCWVVSESAIVYLLKKIYLIAE